MNQKNKGFVVSAVLYPLLVLFLALIMGLLAMTDTRKRILDKMKLEISDSIFDEATCSCDTILNKLNYLIKNGVGGGGGGSYTYNVLGLNVKGYEDPSSMPNVGNGIGDIAVITDTEISNYYVSSKVPESPKVGTVWIVQDKTSNYYVTSDYSKIGISYAMQYICDEAQTSCEWQIKKAYVYDDAKWNLLYYVPVKDGIIDLTSSDINAEITHTYDYTGEYQTFTARFSGYYKVELWGAQGGTYGSVSGGLGAYTAGEIYLNAGQILYVYVGQAGSLSNINQSNWNGGGDGYGSGVAGGDGGGATDIRLEPTTEKNIWNEFESLKSRIMVAAGGGGAAYHNDSYYGHGGPGGGINGYASQIMTGNVSNGHRWAKGATQSQGGYSLNSANSYGGFGYGGNYIPESSYGTGGGGGGYYGGGGGSYAGGPGSGGSSYISGHNGTNSISEISTSNNIIHNGSSFHYSGYYFRNTVMIDGNGYPWGETVANSKVKQPTHDGKSTMTGNTGNGYAKISLLSVEIVDDDSIKRKVLESDNRWNYSYSGSYQEFQAIKSGTYTFELWGAQGGSHAGFLGGNGAYTSGDIYLTKGEKLYIYVGQTGDHLTYDKVSWNGGGKGFGTGVRGGSGGGATDVRITNTSSSKIWNEFESLKSRIMVAAGGGGAAYHNDSYYGHGGPGGGINGYASQIMTGYVSNNYRWASGATQTLGGYAQSAYSNTLGGFGYGGNYSPEASYGVAGGGGGYYGGGGGSNAGGPGGGGSSYISGHIGCNSISEESLYNNIIHTGSAYHYSGKYFINTQMIDGAGYSWTESRGDSSSGMLDYASESIIKGNGSSDYRLSRYGYARVTYKSANTIPKYKEERWNYTYSGNYQLFDVKNNGLYKIELWGAQGAGYGAIYGGLGSYTSGEINLSSGSKLYIYIGAQPLLVASPRTGGWNGGGTGYGTGVLGGGGGGATDIRLNSTSDISIWNSLESLKSRIMVAAGGGGGAYHNDSYYGHGGPGGGLNGYTSQIMTGNVRSGVRYAIGGSQISGGHAGGTSITYGGFGYGGNYSPEASYGTAGGGGGWYGGGGGRNAGGPGGGGSSYISGHAGCIAVTSEGLPKVEAYTTLADSISYTGYKFTNTQMIDGAGYPWSTEKSASSSGMPSPTSSSLMTGNTGNGYARIIYLGA